MYQPRLRITDSHGEKIYPLTKDLVTIGRSNENDIVTSERYSISRRHAQLRRENVGYVIRDCGSVFGTFHNGNRITETQLAHGDRINLAALDLPDLLYLTEGDEAVTVESYVAQDPTTVIGDLQVISNLLENLRSHGSAGVLSDVLCLIVDSAIEMGGADRGFIMLADDGARLSIEIARGKGRINLPASDFRTSRLIPQRTFDTGAIQALDLTLPSLAGEHFQTVELGIHAAVSLPLTAISISEAPHSDSPASKRIGVLYLDSASTIHLCSPLALPSLEVLADKAATAIENVRLLRRAEGNTRNLRVLQTAAEIQVKLQPPPYRKGPFFETAGKSAPCEEVGGDFLDYPVLPDGSLGIALADVFGKGLPAALLASLVQGSFSSLAMYETSPGEVIRRLNRILAARETRTRYVTFHFAVLSPNGRLVSCNAGHMPPIIVRCDGSLQLLEAGGIPLGIYPDSEYEEESVQLHPDDRLILFSDGVTEAISATDVFFGDERLRECIRKSKDLPVRETLECITRTVREFARNGPAMDDMTVLVARYLGAGEGAKINADALRAVEVG